MLGSTADMIVRSVSDVDPFVTADGSTIRELFGLPTGGVEHQSLAEATLAPGQATQRHYHRASEEIYFVLDGEGEMELDGERQRVGVGTRSRSRPARGTSCARRATGRCGSSVPAPRRTGTKTRSSSSRPCETAGERSSHNRHGFRPRVPGPHDTLTAGGSPLPRVGSGRRRDRSPGPGPAGRSVEFRHLAGDAEAA